VALPKEIFVSHASAVRRFVERLTAVLERHKDCNFESLSWTLGDFQHIDFAKNFDAGCRQLLRTWGVAFQPEAPRIRKPKPR